MDQSIVVQGHAVPNLVVGTIMPIDPKALITMDEANNHAIAAWRTGFNEGQDRIVQSIIESVEVQKAERESNQNVFGSILHPLVEGMNKEFGEGVVTRVFLDYSTSTEFAVLFFLERGFFFSAECKRLIADITDSMIWIESNKFNNRINLVANFAVENGSIDVDALRADGYTHYLQYGQQLNSNT